MLFINLFFILKQATKKIIYQKNYLREYSMINSNLSSLKNLLIFT